MPALPQNPAVSHAIFYKIKQFLLIGGLMALAGCASGGDKSDSVDAEGLAKIAAQLHEKGDDSSAANFYSRALQMDPGNSRIRRDYGETLEAHGDLTGAVVQYRTALDLPPSDAVQYRAPKEITSTDSDLIRDYGRVLLKMGKPSDAQAVYSHALQVDADDMRSLNGLGVALDQMNNHDAAQKIYNEALEHKPDDVATLANLGHSYVLSGAYDAAIQLLEPHLNESTATPALRQNLAEAYGMAGMDADAERVSRYDLSPTQIKHNLAYYRSHRARAGSSTSLYADLGKFSTQEMASARAEDVKSGFPVETDGLRVMASPVVNEVGGTPSFAVRVTGFAKPGTLQTFCLKLRKQQIPCTSRIGM